MTAPPDPTLPKDPAEYRPRPVLGFSVWLFLAFGLLCVLAGAALAVLGPRLLPAPTDRAAEPPAAVGAPAGQAAPAEAPAQADRDAVAEIARLKARILALETEGLRTGEAAAAALAAAALIEAAQGSEPFADELAALRQAAPELPELSGLERLAQIGAPSRAALAARFPDYAARAASAARAPQAGDGLSARVTYGLSRIVSVRRVGDVAGSEPDALLARAERALDEGDVDRALRILDGLPPAAREAMAGWRVRAERRAEVDRRAAALRARALRDLAVAGSDA